MFSLHPIAHFASNLIEKRDLPRQGSLAEGNRGAILFSSQSHFEQALEDLQGIERIWVLFWMHQAIGWNPKVRPPRMGKKRGVFATRAPHRPNPIGLSCVRLLSVKGLRLEVESHDILDGSPILDIKPYLPYADSFPGSRIGWLEEKEEILKMDVSWSPFAQKQVEWIEARYALPLQEKIDARLIYFSPSSSSNRIRQLQESYYSLAYRTWRCLFHKEEQKKQMTILCLFSGYDRETLEGKKTSKWDDVPLHREFVFHFQDTILREFVTRDLIEKQLDAIFTSIV